MPWCDGPKKDVVACDMPRGVGLRALIRGCPNGGTWPAFCGSPAAELIGGGWLRGEVKHLSTCWKRYSVSSGERKRRSLNLVRVIAVGCCVRGVVGRAFSLADVGERSDKPCW